MLGRCVLIMVLIVLAVVLAMIMVVLSGVLWVFSVLRCLCMVCLVVSRADGVSAASMVSLL